MGPSARKWVQVQTNGKPWLKGAAGQSAAGTVRGRFRVPLSQEQRLGHDYKPARKSQVEESKAFKMQDFVSAVSGPFISAASNPI